MSRKFFKKDVVLWLHPLGLLYTIRVAEAGRHGKCGEFVIISVGEKCLVLVSPVSLRTISEVAEKNKNLAIELQCKAKEVK